MPAKRQGECPEDASLGSWLFEEGLGILTKTRTAAEADDSPSQPWQGMVWDGGEEGRRRAANLAFGPPGLGSVSLNDLRDFGVIPP